jgi:hypothetical protein
MKTLFLFTLTTLVTLSLSARENPFIPTSTYEEESARLIEANEIENVSEEAYIKEMQEKMMSIPTKGFEKNNIKVEDVNKNKVREMKKDLPKKEIYSQKEVKTLIEKAKKQTVNETKRIIRAEIATVKQQKPEQIVYVKPRADVKEEAEDLKTVKAMEEKPMILSLPIDKTHNKKLLPFLSISYNNTMLKIDTSSKILKNFSINKSMKIIIDYSSKTNFYTKREMLDSNAFKKVTIGNHSSKGFYRVVIELTAMPNMYTISKDMGQLTITKK